MQKKQQHTHTKKPPAVHNSKVWPCTNVTEKQASAAANRSRGQTRSSFESGFQQRCVQVQSFSYIFLYSTRRRPPQRCACKAHVQVAKDYRVRRSVPGAPRRDAETPSRSRRRAVRRFVLVINAEAAAKGNGASPPSSRRTCRATLVSCSIGCKKHVRDQNADRGRKKKYFPSNLKDICLSSAAAAAAAASAGGEAGQEFQLCWCSTSNINISNLLFLHHSKCLAARPRQRK